MEQSLHIRTSMPAVMLRFFKMPLKVEVRLLTCVMLHDRKNLICRHLDLEASQAVFYNVLEGKRHACLSRLQLTDLEALVL